MTTASNRCLYFIPEPHLTRLREIQEELFEVAETSGLSEERKKVLHRMIQEAMKILEVCDE